MKKAEREHVNKVAELGCIACRKIGYEDTPAQIHHIRTGMGTGQKNTNYHVIPLCPQHHQWGPNAIHQSKCTFEADFGTEAELLQWVNELLGIAA